MSAALVFVLGGALFGFGLAWSGMAQPEVVLAFLHLEDLGLLLVMGAALALAFPTVQLAKRTLAGTSPQPWNATLTAETLAGSILFGIGWGLSGVCPGAAFASLGLGNHRILFAIAGMLLGGLVQGVWASRGR